MRRLIWLMIPIGISLAVSCTPSSPTGKEAPTKSLRSKAKASFDLRPNENNAKGHCEESPELANKIMDVGHELGVKIIIGKPAMAGKDATYKAFRGRLGVVTLGTRAMSIQTRCKLISHEYIHVLQHLNGDLKGMKPLDWPISKNAVKRFGSVIEAEAYTHQNRAERVLQLLMRAKEQSRWIKK